MVVQLRGPTDHRQPDCVSCMLLDDLPGPQYGVSRPRGCCDAQHHPRQHRHPDWSAAMGLGDLGRAGDWMVLKFFLQAFFWVQNAWLWDTATPALAHSALGFSP